jgi:hypothetical protein
MPVTFGWLLEADACEMCDLSAPVTAQKTASFLANVASVLMIIFFTLFLRLLHIFFVIAPSIFLLRRLLTISISST